MTHAQNVFGKVIRTFPAFRPSCRRHSFDWKVLSFWFYVSWALFEQCCTISLFPSHVLFITCSTHHKKCRAHSICGLDLKKKKKKMCGCCHLFVKFVERWILSYILFICANCLSGCSNPPSDCSHWLPNMLWSSTFSWWRLPLLQQPFDHISASLHLR